VRFTSLADLLIALEAEAFPANAVLPAVVLDRILRHATVVPIAADLSDAESHVRHVVSTPRARFGSTLARPLSLPVLLLGSWFDILFSSPCSTEPVGAFLVRGARLFVRPRILLVAGVADGFFGVRLLHRFSSFDLQTRYSAVVTGREKNPGVVDSLHAAWFRAQAATSLPIGRCDESAKAGTRSIEIVEKTRDVGDFRKSGSNRCLRYQGHGSRSPMRESMALGSVVPCQHRPSRKFLTQGAHLFEPPRYVAHNRRDSHHLSGGVGERHNCEFNRDSRAVLPHGRDR